MISQRHGRIAIAAPFDFALSCRWRCARTPGWDGWNGREYRRHVWLAGQPARLVLRSRGVVDSPLIDWKLESGEAPVALIEALLREMLADDLDLRGFYTAVEKLAAWRPVCAALTGLRGLRAPSLWEAVAAAILDAQAVERVTATLGREGAFPQAGTVAAQTHALCGLVPARAARALAAAARALREPRVSSESLRQLEGEAALAPLLAIDGVGLATAARALGWGVGHPDLAPAADASVLEAARRLYGRRLPFTPTALGREWRALRGWRGIAAQYATAHTAHALTS